MKYAPYTVVTLLVILETSADAFWRMSGIIGQVIVKLEHHYEFHPDTARVIGSTLGLIHQEALRLNLRSVLPQLERIKSYVAPGSAISQAELRAMLIDLHQRICDDLDDRFFLMIPPENIVFYRQREPLFGAVVESKFPQMSEDISEAGKCFALNLPTACVFHLMRMMEIAVQGFGDKLGVQLATEKNWQNILDEINKAIRKMGNYHLDIVGPNGKDSETGRRRCARV